VHWRRCSWEPERALTYALAGGLDEVALRRLRHVMTERGRVEGVVSALESPAPDATLGALFAEGHRSLRDDFEVSIPALDLLVDLAYEEGAVAARMTGGGFGGAVIALVAASRADAVGGRVMERYATTSGLPGHCLVTGAAQGSGPVEVLTNPAEPN
jgi:galactokinase